MVITIENPTAEAAFEALKQLPAKEWTRLQQLLTAASYGEGYQDFWTDEDLRDLDRATARLIDERFGPEEGNYD